MAAFVRVQNDDIAAALSMAKTGGHFRPSLWKAGIYVRRRMIWNIRGDFRAEVIGSSGLGYAALR